MISLKAKLRENVQNGSHKPGQEDTNTPTGVVKKHYPQCGKPHGSPG